MQHIALCLRRWSRFVRLYGPYRLGTPTSHLQITTKNSRTDQLLQSSHIIKATMKRTLHSSPKLPTTKKRRIDIPDYHLTPSSHDEKGDIIWPAPAEQIQSARDYILEWSVIYLGVPLTHQVDAGRQTQRSYTDTEEQRCCQ